MSEKKLQTQGHCSIQFSFNKLLQLCFKSVAFTCHSKCLKTYAKRFPISLLSFNHKPEKTNFKLLPILPVNQHTSDFSQDVILRSKAPSLLYPTDLLYYRNVKDGRIDYENATPPAHRIHPAHPKRTNLIDMHCPSVRFSLL